MADRYAFQSPFSRGAGDDPWFTVGNVAVTTTVAVTALGLFGLFLVVFEGGFGTISSALLLDQKAITGGQIWRFVTWPIPPNSSAFWALLGLIFFFLIGTQFESMLGRRAFTAMLGAVIVIPSVLGVLTAVVLDQGIPPFGLSMVFLGLAAGFSAALPQARSFFGIPFWVLVAFFFVVQFLDILRFRLVSGLVILIATAAVGLIGTRSLGFAGSVEWIPSVPLPRSISGEGAPRSATPKRSRRSKNKAGLRAVPPPTASDAEIDAVLDQVNEQGLDSLTKQQKSMLEKHAREMKRRRDAD
ncbi:MAG: DUF6576 domain-containing protein [Acidimicrobiales bacterium]